MTKSRQEKHDESYLSGHIDTMKQIVEDTLLAASMVHSGGYYWDIQQGLGNDDREAAVAQHITEVLINLAERMVIVSGIPKQSCWAPEEILDFLDPHWALDI